MDKKNIDKGCVMNPEVTEANPYTRKWDLTCK